MFGPGVAAKRERLVAQQRRKEVLAGIGETKQQKNRRLRAVYGKTLDELASSYQVRAGQGSIPTVLDSMSAFA